MPAKSENGTVRVQASAMQVWIWPPEAATPMACTLLHWQFVTRPTREQLIERITSRHLRLSNATASKYRVDRRKQRGRT
jgi:hypothetical protein